MQTLQMAEQILTVYRINCFRCQGALHNKKVCKRKEMYNGDGICAVEGFKSSFSGKLGW